MPQLIKDNAIVDNLWQRVDAEADSNTLPDGPVIIPLSLWLSDREALSKRAQVAVSITSSDDLEPLQGDLEQLPLIEVYFPTFMDGRGFSQGRLLRERYGYKGELRAGGHFIRDQLCYLRRCGFNAFSFDDSSVDLDGCLQSLNDFTDGYQPSVDQPVPLFARRN